MCFHEIPPAFRRDYIGNLVKVTGHFLALKVFSSEETSVPTLQPAAPGVEKYLFAEDQIRDLFSKDFEIVWWRSYLEDMSPNPPHTDGIVAGKRAYLFRRLRA